MTLQLMVMPLPMREHILSVCARPQLTVHSYGNALVTFDPEAEKRLLRKIDWMVIPTVTIVYLMSVLRVLPRLKNAAHSPGASLIGPTSEMPV
jgi:hypothetical protein